jgi:hypothetical protein
VNCSGSNSRGAATGNSPRRKPWDQEKSNPSPGGATGARIVTRGGTAERKEKRRIDRVRQEELLTFSKKHGVFYAERYLWR